MKRRLFISLSTAALLGLSATGYGTLYIDGHDKDGNIPKSDCLEMMCPGDNWCVEDETLKGYCCPGGNSCRVNGKDISECCGDSKICENGGCRSVTTTCTIGEQVYQNNEAVGDCGKCVNGFVVQDVIKTEDCKSCDTTTWLWQNVTNYEDKNPDGKCCIGGERKNDNVNCPGQCIHLWTEKNGTGDDLGCCEGNLLTDLANTLEDKQGYQKENSQKYGCCPIDRTFDDKCCAEDKIYTTKDGTRKCCPDSSKLPNYDEKCNLACGCKNSEKTGLTCSKDTKKCMCSDGKEWDFKKQECVCSASAPIWDEELQKCLECRTNEDCEYGRCRDNVCIGCTSEARCNEADVKSIKGRKCADNADCGGDGCGYYCHYEGYLTCVEDPKRAMRCTGSTASTCSKPGTCQPIGKSMGSISISGKNLSVSSNAMNWWSAKNWCESNCKKMFDDRTKNPLDCYIGGTTPISSSTMYGQCCAQGQKCDNYNNSDGQSDKIKQLRKKFGEITLWTRYDHPHHCAGGNLILSKKAGEYTISYKHRNKDFYMTKYRSDDHAICE